MTKKQQELLNNYERATKTTLRECYRTWSDAKERAYNRCLNDMCDHNGHGARICSYNTTSFTFAYKYEDENNKTHLRYFTYVNTYDFIID